MDFEFEIIDDENVKITHYTGIAESVTIPDVIQGLPVTSIRMAAFENCESIINIEIPASVANLGKYVFKGCSRLSYIIIPASIMNIMSEYIRDYAEFARNFLSNQKDIQADTFINDVSIIYYDIIDGQNVEIINYIGKIEAVVIPKEIQGLPVTSIGFCSFSRCRNLTSITIPDSVTDIGKFAFRECYKLEHIIIPNSVTSIGEGTFSGCVSLTHISIPDSVTKIRNAVFKGCTNLTHVILPNSITSIGKGAFRNCENLTNITLPNSIITIDDRAFMNCISLTNITIPDSVKSIGDYTFFACKNLVNVTISNTTLIIGRFSFIGYDFKTVNGKKIGIKRNIKNHIDGDFNIDEIFP